MVVMSILIKLKYLRDLNLQFMDQMQLHGIARTAAQKAFHKGKNFNFPLREKVRQLSDVYFNRPDLIRIFIDIQIRAALVDNVLHPKERDILHIIFEELGISTEQFEKILSGYSSSNYQNYSRKKQSSTNQQLTVEQAREILGVKQNDDLTIIRRAYYRLMGKYHPDKLGRLSPEVVERATKKAQIIQKSWDLLKKENRSKP